MEVDLSAFPIIRLDHIPYVDDETLIKAASEIEYMLESSDNSNPRMDKYLMKQYDAMKKQIAERSAAFRISQLLNGAQELLNQPVDYSSFFETKKQNLSTETDSSTASQISSKDDIRKIDKPPEISKSFVPLPLPSQRTRAPIITANTTQENNVPQLPLTSQLLQKTSEHKEASGNLSPRSINSSRSNHSKKSGGNNNEIDEPSKKGMEVVYKNFGSTFVVAATERRRRFYPKKSVESLEEAKQREKAERRKVAMQRLLKRKEEREMQQQKLREKGKLAKIAAQKALQQEKRKEVDKDVHSESSDSESVSGGDDDPEIQVDEKVVASVQQALEDFTEAAVAESLGETLPLPPPKLLSNELKLKDNKRPSLPAKKKVESISSIVPKGNGSSRSLKSNNVNKSMSVQLRGNKSEQTLKTSTTVSSQQFVSESPIEFNFEIENSEAAEANTKDFQAKNLAALMAIRKMKEARLKSSQSCSEIQTSSEEVIPDRDQVQDNCQEKTLDSDKNATNIEHITEDSAEHSQHHAINSNDFVLKPPTPRSTENEQIEDVEKKDAHSESIVIDSQKHVEDHTRRMENNVDLFDFVDGVYVFNYAPDDIPGLACFKWEKQWETNVSNYCVVTDSSSSSQVFLLRAKDRQVVPFGLILLCEECKDILMGYISISSIEELLRLWQDCITSFDHQSNASYQVDESELFQQVTVCGNGFTICRKLEKLIQQFFHRDHDMDPDNYTLSQRLNIDSNDEELELQVIEDIAQCAESLEEVHDDGEIEVDEANTQQENYLVDGQLMEDDNGFEPSESSMHYENVPNEETYNGDREIDSISNISAPKVAEGDISFDSIHSKGKIVSTVNNNLRKSRESTRIVKSTIPKPLSKSSTAVNEGDRLVDYYPHFGMIFPVAYKQLGSVREDGGAAARALIESMQLQARLYEDWVEVMKDYSTVFCSGDQDDETTDNAKEKSAEVYKGGSSTLHFRVKSSRSEVFNIISDVFAKTLPDWLQLPSGLGLGLSWNLLWTWSKPHINMAHLLIWQRVNHFEDSRQLTRKDLLKKNIQRYVDIGNKISAEFEIMPKTFVLPHEYTQFVQSYTYYENMKKEEIKTIGTTQLHNYWILKPVGLSRGRGISLITDINDITYSQASVIQKYIERPLCLHGYKFDLRIYVVVTSFHPLEAFIFRDGFARVSTQEYSLHSNDAQNKFIHLTNSSIQKYNMTELKSNNPISEQSDANKNEESSDVGGSKISLLGNNGLWNRLKLFGINIDQVWQDMCLCIVKSLVMVDEKIAYQPCCFELFGYDILIDSNLRPWLLEVNASPSLARENHLDHRVKNALIHDIIELLDIPAYDREALAKILRKRLQSITSKKRYLYGSNDTELEQDLRAILGDYRPRRYGEPPKQLGQFECLCPNTKNYDTVLKLKKKIIKPLNEEG